MVSVMMFMDFGCRGPLTCSCLLLDFSDSGGRICRSSSSSSNIVVSRNKGSQYTSQCTIVLTIKPPRKEEEEEQDDQEARGMIATVLVEEKAGLIMHNKV